MVSEVEEFLVGMLPRQLAAEHALCRGDAGPRSETWSQRAPVTLFGAAVPVRSGWDEVSSTFRWLANRFTELCDYEFELVAAAAGSKGLRHRQARHPRQRRNAVGLRARHGVRGGARPARAQS
jgi:hypothetical protein